LALDLGTTGNRALIIDREQQVVAQAYREFKQYYPQPGWVEHDAEEILASTLAVAKTVLAQVKVKRIGAVGITNQRETVVLWDKQTGKPIHNAIVWQCRRTSEECERLKRQGLEAEVHQRTGLYLDPYFSATKIDWLLNQNSAWRRAAEEGDILAGTIDSWLVYCLTSGKVHATDASNASRTLLFNLQTGQWDDEQLRIFNIPRAMLPRLVPSSGMIGETSAAELGIQLPIAGLIGDQQSALFAQGCHDPGSIKNTYGTGLFLLANTGSQPDFIPGLITTVAWNLAGKLTYACEGSVFIGGAAIQWLRDELKIIQNADETEALAQSIPDNQGVYFVPALVGLGAPYWDSRARGLMIGLTRGTSRAHLVRAALEAIAYQTRDTVSAMLPDRMSSLQKLKVDGGACRNDFLMQFQADILGVPVERPLLIETTALGAAGMAGLAIGLWSSPQDFVRHAKIERVFTPVISASQREKLYTGWQQAVARARNWAKD